MRSIVARGCSSSEHGTPVTSPGLLHVRGRDAFEVKNKKRFGLCYHCFKIHSSSRFPYVSARWWQFWVSSENTDFSLSTASFLLAALLEKLSGSNIYCRRLLRNGCAVTGEQMFRWGTVMANLSSHDPAACFDTASVHRCRTSYTTYIHSQQSKTDDVSLSLIRKFIWLHHFIITTTCCQLKQCRRVFCLKNIRFLVKF